MHGIFCGRKASVSWTSGIWTQLLNDWLATIRTASRHRIVCASSWMHRKWSGSGTGRYISPHFQLTIHWLCGGDVPMSTTNCPCQTKFYRAAPFFSRRPPPPAFPFSNKKRFFRLRIKHLLFDFQLHWMEFVDWSTDRYHRLCILYLLSFIKFPQFLENC